MKRKVLIAYPEMMVGGSTTSLLAFLKLIDKETYDVDLQLYKKQGKLLDDIPKDINLLPEAFAYNGRFGNLIKKIKFILTGFFLKARKANQRIGKSGYSGQVMADFQAKCLSQKAKGKYDIAIGFLEGWSDRYIAYQVDADKKIAWLHSTFENITKTPDLEREWMSKVDNIVFVAESCTEDFKKAMPDMASKAVTIQNITDSEMVRARAKNFDENDKDFLRFQSASGFKIVTVCRATIFVKGLDRLITCAKHLKQCDKNFIWYIIGGGEDLARFRSMIGEADLSDCVFAIDNRTNPLPFVKEAHAFCMLSRFEGKPMVITESMILGTPPFVTRYLSADEQIENGVDGVVVDNGEDTMYEVLIEYIENESKLNTLRQKLASREYGNSEYIKKIENDFL